MDGDRRRIPGEDRVIASIVLALGAALGVAAPVAALPWALEPGLSSPRFALFSTAVLAAWWLGGSAALPVVRRLRGG